MGTIIGYLVQSHDTLQAAIDDPAFCRTIEGIAEATVTALRNGGSAADAQHIAGEMLSRLNFDRAPAAPLALTTDSSVMTAVANDYGYGRIFERQILGLSGSGDVLIAISTSGRSPKQAVMWGGFGWGHYCHFWCGSN